MTTGVVLMILTAALLHASWNALVKGANDRPLMLGLISTGHVVSGVVILALVGSPGWVVLPYVAGSTGLGR